MRHLFMVLLGATPPGRNVEQHDVFFGVGESLASLAPQFEAFWPGVRVHVDAWMRVEQVDGHPVSVSEGEVTARRSGLRLFFINLGGYQPGKFEEYHDKFLVVARSLAEATARAKQAAFMSESNDPSLPRSARPHVDDKYAFEQVVFEPDDVIDVQEALPRYAIEVGDRDGDDTSAVHVGYVSLSKLYANGPAR